MRFSGAPLAIRPISENSPDSPRAIPSTTGRVRAQSAATACPGSSPSPSDLYPSNNIQFPQDGIPPCSRGGPIQAGPPAEMDVDLHD